MIILSKLRFAVLVLWGIVIVPYAAFAGIPDVSNVMVTDVTTVSFSVIWASSEAATASLEVFQDGGGTTPVIGANITPHPLDGTDTSIKVLAENNGVMKVRVTGLTSDTTYYFRTVTTSKSSSDTTYFPVAPELMSVTTEYETVRTINSGGNLLPFSNDLILHACYLDDGVTPANGTLLLATVTGGNYPVSAFIGDSVPSPYALIDLNNVFSRDSNENIDLSSGENLLLHNFRGMLGNAIVSSTIPLDNSLVEVKNGGSGLVTGWNFISVSLEPTDPSLETVLASLDGKITSIWAYDSAADSWKRYDWESPYPWLNDLAEVHALKGYWVLMNQEGSLSVNGDLVVGNTMQLVAGWNLVGFRGLCATALSEAVASISDKIQSVWTYDSADDQWLRYDWSSPYPWLNDLESLEPGKAYWINVSEDCVW